MNPLHNSREQLLVTLMPVLWAIYRKLYTDCMWGQWSPKWASQHFEDGAWVAQDSFSFLLLLVHFEFVMYQSRRVNLQITILTTFIMQPKLVTTTQGCCGHSNAHIFPDAGKKMKLRAQRNVVWNVPKICPRNKFKRQLKTKHPV